MVKTLKKVAAIAVQPFKYAADITVNNYAKQLRDIKELELRNRLKYADSPEERLDLLKKINLLRG